jgi:hypothetical protein
MLKTFTRVSNSLNYHQMKKILFILICVIMVAFGATAAKNSTRTATLTQQKVTAVKTISLKKVKGQPVLVADAIFQSSCGDTWYYTGPPLDASQIDYIFFLINGACITGETFFFLPW